MRRDLAAVQLPPSPQKTSPTDSPLDTSTYVKTIAMKRKSTFFPKNLIDTG